MARIGGVPEHFNLPWRRVLAQRDDEWVDFGGGSGAMARALESGELDAAVMLTESAVKAIAGGLDAHIVGTHVESPLRWGIHTASGADLGLDFETARFAVSRMGSGSHLIPCVMADEHGFDVAKLNFVEVGTIAGGRDALCNGAADLFFWEQFMTQPLVDDGSLERIDVFLPPWPSFVVVGRDEWLDTGYDVTALLALVDESCEQLSTDAERTTALISDTYGMSDTHADEWLELTDWRCSSEVEAEGLTRTVEAIAAAFGQQMPAVDQLVRCGLR